MKKHEDGRDERFCQDGDPVRGPFDDTQQTRHSRCSLDSNPVFYQLMECSSASSVHPTVKEENEDPWCGKVENKICFERDHMHSNIDAAQNQVSKVTQYEFPGLRNNFGVEESGNKATPWNLGQSDFRNIHSLKIQSLDLDLWSDNQKVDEGFAQGNSQRSDDFEKDAKQGNSVMTDGISEFDVFDERGGIQLQGKFTTGNNDSNQESLALPNHRSIQLKFEPRYQFPSRQDFPITSERKMPEKEAEPPKKVPRYILPECNKGLTWLPVLQSHIWKKHNRKQFYCKECGMQYINEQSFRHHRRLHVGENLFTCVHCDKKFVLKSQLDNHAVVHEVKETREKKPRRFTCPECNEGFTRVARLRSHRLEEHGQKPFSCKECGIQYIHEESFRRHMRLHIGENLFTCTHCDKKFVLKSRLKHHAVVHEVKETREKKPRFTCPECNEGFTRVARLRSHRLQEHGQKPFSCKECGMQYICKQTFRHHRQLHIRDNLFTCTHCDKKFVRKSHLKHHAVVHEVNRMQITCQQCGKHFTRSRSLKSHSKRCPADIRNTVNNMFCSVCNKGFRFVTQLKAHTRMVHKVFFPCFECDKRFRKESTLRVHTLMCHFFEKPFTCNVCDKQFTWRKTGYDHSRIHTGETPYVCDKCNIGFTFSSSLNRHARIHTGERPYVRDECDRGFKRMTSLNRHAKNHTVIETCVTDDGCNEHSAWKPSNLSVTLEGPREDHCKKTVVKKLEKVGEKRWYDPPPRIPGQVDVLSVNHTMDDSQLK